jgi:hypothetical protein
MLTIAETKIAEEKFCENEVIDEAKIGKKKTGQFPSAPANDSRIALRRQECEFPPD